jgi:prepilin-type N-terminal cleavage/methylation domain-containing protein
MKSEKQKGFTLIELLVVITIIAILAIAITVGYRTVKQSAYDAKRVETARSIATAQEIYYQQNSSYADLAELIDQELLNSNPDELGDNYMPHREGSSSGTWSSRYWVDARTNDFYVRVLNWGDDFCCTDEGCREVERFDSCGWDN